MTRIFLYGRISFSVVCGLLCVLLIVLWVRSYWYEDSIYRNGNWTVAAYSYLGEIFFEVHNDPFESAPADWSFDTESIDAQIRPPTEVWYLLWDENIFDLNLRLYHALLLSIFATIASIPWLPWRGRFSLRTLLIALTLVGLLLGTIIYATR